MTMLEKRTAAALAQQETRKDKLAAKRAKRAAKATERARIDALPLVEQYSDMKLMSVEDLRDQLEKQKLLGETGYALSLPNCTAHVLQLQTWLLKASEDANGLEDGGSGIDGRSVRRRATVRSRKRRRGLRSYMGYYSGPRRGRRHSRCRLQSARFWPTGRRSTATRAASLQASSSTASRGRIPTRHGVI
eukprot:6198671-Pleurochrysis_carterae.AAC.2